MNFRFLSVRILALIFALTPPLTAPYASANSVGFKGIVATAWCESGVQDLKALVDQLKLSPKNGGYGLKNLGSTKTFDCPDDLIQSVRTRSGERIPPGASCIEFYISLKDLKVFSQKINESEYLDYEVDNVGEAFYTIAEKSDFRCRFKLSQVQAEIEL